MKGVTKSSIGKALYQSLALACVMFSGYVGPGFSAGTQTVQYYLTRGWIGVFIGPIIVSILTFISTYINFEFSRRYRPQNFIVSSNSSWRSPVLRRALAIFKDVMFILSTFVGMAAMNSTICGILEYLYQIPTMVTTIVFVVLSVILAVYGMKVLNATGTFSDGCHYCRNVLHWLQRLPYGMAPDAAVDGHEGYPAGFRLCAACWLLYHDHAGRLHPHIRKSDRYQRF